MALEMVDKMKITEIDYTTEPATVKERDLTTAELAQLKTDKANEAARQLDLDAKATAKAALLERLGITAEEASLLLS
jgi:hypothetical protein